MRLLKRSLDPRNILNPGKVIELEPTDHSRATAPLPNSW